MRPLAELELVFDEPMPTPDIQASADDLLRASEEVLEHWITARGEIPTDDNREGFRLLALHRQGAKGDPSFNACRETCREIVYHYNLVTMQPEHSDITDRLYAGLGEFCCAAKPIRSAMDNDSTTREEA
jgi:hypothetical protein